MMNSKYDFPMTNEYDKENVLEVQKILLNMAKSVASVLDKNKIRYMLVFGSLLGGVREGGFIPWDDDLDFLILEEDYDEALKCLEGSLPEFIIIQNMNTDPKYAASWTKLRYKYSETYSQLFETDNLFTYRGICLDLYRCESVLRKDVDKVVLKENIDYFNRKYNILGAITKEQLEEKMRELKPLYENAVKNAETSNMNEQVFAFPSIYKLNYYLKDWVFPLKKYKFEDTEFWGPNDADKILSLTYGDYMSVPPYEKRNPHYTWVRIFK